jgi:hypothetical protein
LTIVLAAYWRWRGYHSTWEEILAAHPDGVDNDPAHLAVLPRARASVAFDRGEYRQAVQIISKAAELAQSSGMPGLVAILHRRAAAHLWLAATPRRDRRIRHPNAHHPGSHTANLPPDT